MLTFYVPPGIGDFSAMYAKLCNINREIVIRTANDEPHRLPPFLELLPKIRDGGYAAHSAGASLVQTLPPGTDLASLPDGDYFLAVNEWLEKGGKIAQWIPGETTYHYFMDTAAKKQRIDTFFRESVLEFTPVVGVYCSAYGNARHWNFWTYEKWREFLERVVVKLPQNTHYIFIGAEYDVQIAEILHNWMQSVGMNSRLTLGSFHIGETIELLKRLDYFFSFPSGLGFLADVVNTPNMMWFPEHLKPMMDTFTDPANFLSWQSYHAVFDEPEVAALQFETIGLTHLRERWEKRKSSLMHSGKK